MAAVLRVGAVLAALAVVLAAQAAPLQPPPEGSVLPLSRGGASLRTLLHAAENSSDVAALLLLQQQGQRAGVVVVRDDAAAHGMQLNNTFWLRDRNHTFSNNVMRRVEELLEGTGGTATVTTTTTTTTTPPHYYPNATAVFQGKWIGDVPAATPTPLANVSLEAASVQFLSQHGVISFTWNDERGPVPSVNTVVGTMRLRDASGHNTLSLTVQGVHLTSFGTIVIAGSARPSRLKMLPFIMPTETLFTLVDQHVQAVSDDEEYRNTVEQYEQRRTKNLATHQRQLLNACDFYFMFHMTPLPPDVRISRVMEFERELTDPSGLPTIDPPALEMTGSAFSQSCPDIGLNATATGMRLPLFFRKTILYNMFAVVATALEIVFTIHQMGRSRSQMARSKIAMSTVGLQAVLDSYMCLLHLTTGIIFEKVFNAFALVSFLKVVLFSMLEMRFLLSIWKAHRPRSTNEAMRREFGVLYMLYYASLVLGMVLFYQAQNVWVRWLAFVLYAFWIPQIVHNFQNSCRKPLSRWYIVGMTFARMWVPLYFFVCPANIFGLEPFPLTGWYFALFLIAQMFVLLLQDIMGPRLFFWDRETVVAHNYYVRRPLGATDAEAAPAAEEFMCVICMTAIDITAVHMETPCHHKFHSPCLEQWMRLKMECPTCRTDLPSE